MKKKSLNIEETHIFIKDEIKKKKLQYFIETFETILEA